MVWLIPVLSREREIGVRTNFGSRAFFSAHVRLFKAVLFAILWIRVLITISGLLW